MPNAERQSLPTPLPLSQGIGAAFFVGYPVARTLRHRVDEPPTVDRVPGWRS